MAERDAMAEQVATQGSLEDIPYTCQTCGCNHVMTMQQYCDAVRAGAMDGLSPAGKAILQGVEPQAGAQPEDIRWITTPEGNLKPTLQAGAQGLAHRFAQKMIQNLRQNVAEEKARLAGAQERRSRPFNVTEELANSVEELIAENTRLEARLNTIRDYVLAAQQTPITRESILAAPQVERYRIGLEGELEKHPAGLIVTYPDHLDAIRAKTLTELTLFDEAHGLYNLVLSETGGTKQN